MMKKNLLTSCWLIIFSMFMCNGLLASNEKENFCFNADVPEAQDNLSDMCLTAPTLFCPATYLGCPSDNIDPTNTGFPTALPGDVSCPNPIVSFTDEVVTNTACLKIIHRTWEATYPPGSASIKLHSTCQQTLYLEDNSVPEINNCPADIVIDLSTNCDSTVIWPLPQASDDCGIQLFLTTNYSGTTFPSGTTTVTYTAQDFCGNVATCSFDVTINGSCCTAPVLSCPVDVNSCPIVGDITPATTGTATAMASDSSCGTPIVEYADSITSTGPCNGQQTIQRTWSATDPNNSNYTTSCVQLINVVDNTDPIITNTPSNITVNGNGSGCQVAVTWSEPTVEENCNLASWTSTHNSGHAFAEGTHTVSYTAIDDCGNTATSSFTVTVNCICNVAPNLTCPSNYTACPDNPSISPSITGQATATAGDPTCGTPAINYTDQSLSTGPCADEISIIRTWTATVQNNNALTTDCVQTITIQDNEAPIITGLPQNITLTGTGNNCTVPATWTAPVATDDCGIANLTSNYESGHNFVSGTTAVVYTATDNCGKTTTETFNIIVDCNLCVTPPSLTCPVDYNGCTTNGYPMPTLTGAASAVLSGAFCTGLPIIDYTDTVISQGPCQNAYDITRVWTATDPNDSNLTVSCSQQITTYDNTAPTLTNIPTDLTVHANGPRCTVPVKWSEPIATDNCGNVNMTSTHTSGATLSEGITAITYTAFDDCGNSTVHSFNVTVECAACNVPPSISCPSNYSVCPGGLLPSPSVAGIATASMSSASCGTPFVFYSDFIAGFGTCSGAYTANRTWTAFDPMSGLTSSCVQTLQLDDTSIPEITNTPQDITVMATGSTCEAVVTWTTPVATDNCTLSSLTANYDSGSVFSAGTTPITYTATDNCGNITTTTFNVTVECAGCTTPPSITCPATYTTCPGSNFPGPSVAGSALATAGSADCGTPILTYNDVMSSFGSCSGALTYVRNWTAVDPDNSSLSSSCMQTIIFEDTEAPTLTNIPADLTVTGNGTNCQIPVTWTAPLANDNCGIESINATHDIGSNFSVGTTSVIYTTTDNCGNATTAAFNVTVNCLECNTPPSITCPSNYTACTTSTTSPSTTGIAIASTNGANCTGTPTVSYTDTVNATGPCAGAQEILRTWIANDASTGLSASCTHVITLEDNLAPEILGIPSNITVTANSASCQEVINWTAPTVSDNCGATSLTSSITNGSTFYEGITTVTYTATDNCGDVTTAAFTVTIDCGVCNTPPSVTCPANFETCAMNAGIPNPIESGFAYSIIDGPNCSGSPYMTYNDQVVNSGPCAGAMEIERTWIATDPSNKLQGSCIQLISLVDNVMPVISGLPTDIIVSGNGTNCNVPVTWTAPSASDDCGIASLVSDYSNGQAFSEGTTAVTYTATDHCGNTATASFNVIVNCIALCDTPPAITCPGHVTTCPSSPINPSDIGIASAVNVGTNCVGVPLITYNDLVTPIIPCSAAQLIERTWTATDPNTGLASTCEQTITLVDNTPPTFTFVPADISVTASGANCTVPVTWSAPIASDNCGLVTEPLSSYLPGTNFGMGSTTVTYTASDECGNSTTAAFTVTVSCEVCDVAPAITCPSDLTICPDASTSPSTTGVATAIAGGPFCTAEPAITYNDLITPIVPCQGAQTVERFWTASDNSTGLTSSCLQQITLVDNIAPTLYNIPADLTVNGNGSGCSIPVTWTAPSATDNCGMASEPLSNYLSGSTFPEGVTPVTYTATDECGNSNTATFTVTVICAGCTTPPAITCPTAYTSCPGDSTLPSVTGTAWASITGANCNGNPQLGYADHISSTGPCIGQKTIERTWTATNPMNGLSASCMQLITLEDNSAPIIVGLPSDITVQGLGSGCSAAATWTVPTATDNCGIDGVPTCAYTVGDIFDEGSTTVIYTATDNCGNSITGSFTVTVICTAVCDTAPVITCPADYTTCPTPNIPTPAEAGEATAQATGSVCGTPVITYSDAIISNGPCADARQIARIWTATDPNDTNLIASCTQNIFLKDDTAPTIANCPIGQVIAGMITSTGSGTGSGMGGGSICSGIATWTNPIATDDCNSATVICTDDTGTVVNSGDSFPEGTTLVTCTATDLCGNETTCAFDIVVTCNEDCTAPPLVTCPADATVCIGADYSVASLGDVILVTGPFCPPASVTHEDLLISSGPCNGEAIINRTFTGQYPSIPGSEASCLQVITIENSTPTFMGCPENIFVNDETTPVYWTAPTLVDACGTATVSESHISGSTFTCGNTTVTYTATDICGNITTCSFEVIVDCINAAGFSYCPQDMTLTCSGGGTVANWTAPIYNNTCNNCAMGANIPGFLYMGTYEGSQYYCSVAPATWPVANASCEANGGFLVNVNGAGENQFLANMLTTQSAWIGLTDVNSEGTFEWTNGDPLTYTNWYPGQPNNFNGNQDYCELLSTGEWNDQYNTYALEYIMEIPCNYVTQTSGPAPGSILTGGTYVVSYGVTNGCNTNETCSFTITVEETMEITCPADITVTAAPGTGSAIAEWSAPVANSCCASCSGSIPGFIYMGAHNGHHYYCSTTNATWHNAYNSCIANGGYLASVETAAENAFLANFLIDQNAWLGGNDLGNEGNFSWNSGAPFSYTNWYVGQPNNYNYGQHCIEMLSDGTWNDQYSNTLLEYILEIPDCINTTQTAGPASGSSFTVGTTTTISYAATDGCGNSASCSFDVTVIPASTTAPCASYGTNSANHYIESATIGSLTNVSGHDNGYADYTSLCEVIEPSAVIPIQLCPGYGAGSSAVMYWSVWIDFNQDGDFVDNYEFVAYGAGSQCLNGNITIPSSIPNGQATLRVTCKLGGYATDPCEIYSNGETEDYCVTIINGTTTIGEPLSNRSRVSNEATELVANDTVQENEDILEVNIYPNPVSHVMNIELSDTESIAQINLLDQTGRTVLELRNINAIMSEDISNLPSGMYLLSVTQLNGTVTTERILIAR